MHASLGTARKRSLRTARHMSLWGPSAVMLIDLRFAFEPTPYLLCQISWRRMLTNYHPSDLRICRPPTSLGPEGCIFWFWGGDTCAGLRPIVGSGGCISSTGSIRKLAIYASRRVALPDHPEFQNRPATDAWGLRMSGRQRPLHY